MKFWNRLGDVCDELWRSHILRQPRRSRRRALQVDRGSDAVDGMLRRLRAAAEKLGGDPTRELHERRRRERAIEAGKHERWGH